MFDIYAYSFSYVNTKPEVALSYNTTLFLYSFTEKPSINDATHLGGRGGGSGKRCHYPISLFSKTGDKRGERGVEYLIKWVTSFMDGP